MEYPKLANEEDGVVVNSRIIDAARLAVRGGGIEGVPVEISGYPKMYVAKGEAAEIASLTYFSEEEVRYTVGPLKRE